MLTYAQLAKLEKSVRDHHVLNVYIDATELDNVSRRSWRRTLAAAVVALRKSLEGAPHAQRVAFDRAAQHVAEVAGGLVDDLDGAPGWCLLATRDEVIHSGSTDRAPGTSATWRSGVGVAPYLRLFDDETVIVGVVGIRATDLYRCDGRTTKRVEHVNAHAHLGRAVHMGDVPHERFHAGTRGTALTDAAQHALEVGRERMLHDVADELDALARPHAWVVLTGARETVSDAMRHLGRTLRKRTIYVPGLGTGATDAEIAQAAIDGKRRLERTLEMERVTDLIDRAAARGRARVGLDGTREAALAGAARDVYVTSHFLEQHPAEAEELALAALTHGARFTPVLGDAAARLDEVGGGVATALRFGRAKGRAESAAATAGAR